MAFLRRFWQREARPDESARADRRRTGGWAALLFVIATVVGYVSLSFVSANSNEPITSTGLVAFELFRYGVFFIAVVCLDTWLRTLDRTMARFAVVLGAGGSIAMIAGESMLLVGQDALTLTLQVSAGASIAIGGWYVLTGTVLSRSDVLRRVGWTGQLGGAGIIFVGVVTLVPFTLPSQANGGPGLLDYAAILVVFSIVFLVRIWRYAGLGRLPGPGLI